MPGVTLHRDDTGGTYTLLVALDALATVEVGALGPCRLRPGHYAYTGSALGPGGFARVDRHLELARGERDVAHWHVDSLLRLDGADVEAVVCSPGVDAECTVARAVATADAVEGEPIPGFGATDCACETHLSRAPEEDLLQSAVVAAHPHPGASGLATDEWGDPGVDPQRE